MSSATGPVGTLEVALDHAARLATQQPELAIEQAQEILRVIPGHPIATLILGVARRNSGDLPAALAILTKLAGEQPNAAAAQYELGVALGLAGRGEEAVDALRRAVQLKPDIGDAWRMLGDHLTAVGDVEGADAAYANHVRSSIRDPRLLEPAAALYDGRIAVAEALLREHLKSFPTDVAAIRMLAEVAGRLGRYADAEALLTRCLELAPGFAAARHNYALVLHREGKSAAALTEIEKLLVSEPRNPGYRALLGAILSRLGEYERSIDVYEQLLADYPRQHKVWLSYGHSLKTAGRTPQSVAAYRRGIELQPGFGEAYWSLANLKTFRFTTQDVAEMEAQIGAKELPDAERMQFHFALGKAYEDAGDAQRSFEHYLAGNRLRRATVGYDPEDTSRHVRRSKQLLDREFFAARSGAGAPAADPIFVVGLPRSGSTLVEQILSSHSAVEGTMELPDLLAIARELGGDRGRGAISRYLELLPSLDATALRGLGERYLAQTRVHRKSTRPFFIDKMPNNWAHVGLIHLILPNARIVDARRHPMSCGFSLFKQHFARGQNFSYDLADIGRYYRDYVELMAHFDEVLPGRVHRVIYEDMVDDTESAVRQLLAHCGLPFEERCLRFHENERAVRTASSEQVRRPIYRDSVEQWRHYETWLAPLAEALGPVVESYPCPPKIN